LPVYCYRFCVINHSSIYITPCRDPHVSLVWYKTTCSVCYAGVDVELIICIPAPAFSSSCIFSPAYSGPAFSAPRIFGHAFSGSAFSGPPFSASPVCTRCCCRWCRLRCVCGYVFSCCLRGVSASTHDLRCRCAVSCSNTTSELYFHSVSGISIARNIACPLIIKTSHSLISHVSSSFPSSPLSPSITPSLFHSRLKTPLQSSSTFLPTGLILRTPAVFHFSQACRFQPWHLCARLSLFPFSF